MSLVQKFSSLSLTTKIIIVILVLLVLYWIFYVEIPAIKLKYFQPKSIDLQPGETVDISETRKRYLQNLASRLYDNIYSTLTFEGGNLANSGHPAELYNEANALTDNELLYLSGYYKRYLSNGATLYSDIDGEYFFFSDAGKQLMAHLSKIGER
jgi:hypothetical protein